MNHGKFPKQDDSYAFEEDSSSESLSPEQHHSDESQGSACPSSEAVGSTPSSSSPALTSPRQVITKLPFCTPSDQQAVRHSALVVDLLSLSTPLPPLWFFCPPVVAKETALLPREKTFGTQLNPAGVEVGGCGDGGIPAREPPAQPPFPLTSLRRGARPTAATTNSPKILNSCQRRNVYVTPVSRSEMFWCHLEISV